MFSFILCLIAIAIISVILFMPAFIELKKPKDNGPRQIMGVKLGYCGPLLYVEDEVTLEKVQASTLTLALTMLPNLEV